MDARELALLAAEAAVNGRAEKVVLLDLQGLSSVSDLFVICSAETTIQTRAIADGIVRALRAEKVRPGHIEGYKAGHWILLDYGSFVAHVFDHQSREFYGLERLWGDAPVLEIEPQPTDRA